jgi:hypothetical protein
MVVAVLWMTVGAVSDAAPLQVEPSVSWSIHSTPTCPSLHLDSINGGSDIIGIDAYVEGGARVTLGIADIFPDDHLVLDLSPASVGQTLHRVVLWSFNSGDQLHEWLDVQVFCTGATVPSPPRQGVATPANGTATVSWLPPVSNGGAPVQHYELSWFIGDALQGRAFAFDTDYAFGGGGLINGVEYRFELRAYNDIGYSPVSKVKPITVGTPTAPTIGTATAGNGSATVSWTPPATDNGSPILGYVVTPYIGYFPLSSVAFNDTATTQMVTGLTNGTQYRFRVQAFNTNGTGLYSTVTNSVTPTAPTPPGAPTIIRNATAGDSSATVNWIAPATDGGSPITGYVVTPYIGYFALSPINFDATVTTRTVTGFTNGTEYRFRVQAVNAIGTSGYSKVTNPVTPTP